MSVLRLILITLNCLTVGVTVRIVVAVESATVTVPLVCRPDSSTSPYY